MRRLTLSTDAWPEHPGLDTGISHALVREVGAGMSPETLRLHRTPPIVAFGRRDAVSGGYPAAVAASRQLGFLPIERLAGGRAAVFHEETLAFAWAQPAAEPRREVEGRFLQMAEIVAEALGSLGVDARIGPVPGEYCPGSYSVNAAGHTKLMGVGQRLVRGAAHVGGVVVAGGADRIREVLVPVYEALGIEWRPETVGSVAAEVEGISIDDVAGALRSAFERRFEVIDVPISPALVDAGRALITSHLPPE